MVQDRGFATLPLPPDRRVAGWTQAVSDRFVESGFEIAEPEAFDAAMLNRDLADLSLTHFRSAGHGRKLITRSQRQTARAAEEFFLLALQLQGRGAVRQAGREVWLQPGECAIYDTRRPYELAFDADYRQAVLRIPRRELVARLGDCDARVASAVAGDALPARLLRRMFAEACNTAVVLPPAAGRDIADAIVDVLAGGLRGLRGDAPLPHAAAAPLARVKAHVLARLHDPALSPPRIAAELGLSTRSLHQLFRAEGCTLARWLWAQRLAACERALRDPARAAQTITRIAYDHGFSDAAHFSRAFAQRYGRSPRAHRRAAPS
ncbi:MAG TPA: helix-turn-helix domain-containing protein [Methylibium sp.]|nr:helix-turn-helix domain-containing protein [Methylibium sp.]